MEHKIEKKRFYIAEFEQEIAWLSFMHQEGWKLVKTNRRKYEFVSCKKENWIYQMDFKGENQTAENYIHQFTENGWEFIFHYRNWFYFRKNKITNGKEEDLSLFNDNDSKIELCKSIINGNFLIIVPIYIFILVYNYLFFFTPIFRGNGVWTSIAIGIASVSVLVLCFGIGVYIGELSRLNKKIQDLEF